jgi:hypothetical protein
MGILTGVIPSYHVLPSFSGGAAALLSTAALGAAAATTSGGAGAGGSATTSTAASDLIERLRRYRVANLKLIDEISICFTIVTMMKFA